ncbi:MAG TPA: helix-turn-helix transcriptional regulator [Patescibacteria group bacterium]|nr:helix-turn-helix transcriptional regulator [Patescibacteria group bacterium]
MNKSQLKQKTVSLNDFGTNVTKEEREFIESEKKYYQVVVALRKKREDLGLTQTKLAKLAKLPRTTITKVESGSRNVTLQILMAMAQAMGKKVELKLS